MFENLHPDNIINRYEFDALTFLTATRSTPSESVAIVAIDEPSFAELKLQWPWPRSIYAQLIRQLKQSGATVIGMDIGFHDQSNINQDDELAAAIAESNIVVLSSYTDQIDSKWLKQTRIVNPVDKFIEAGAITGNVTVNLDSDGVIRRLPAINSPFWSSILQLYNKSSPPAKHLSEVSYIRYGNPEKSFPITSFYQALDPAHFLPADFFQNRIVLVGYMNNMSPVLSSGLQDTFTTPFTRFTGKSMYGTEIHAHMIDAALNQSHITKAHVGLRISLFTLTLFFSWLAFKNWHPWSNALAAVSFSLLVFCFSIFNFYQGIWLPFILLLSGVWISYFIKGCFAYLGELSMRRYLRKAFSCYVSEGVINRILTVPEKLNLGGERNEVSFIFTDIADFTPLTEKIPAHVLVEVINDYFEGMSRIIFSYNGTIERFVGDSLVVFFNAPVKQKNHANLSVKCALEMNSFGLDFAKQQKENGIPFGNTRIGINTGTVSVGNYGGRKRFHYTAMGDAINIAARLESANKKFGTTICVSHETAKRCPEIVFRPIGKFRLKGKSTSLLVMEPLDENNFNSTFLDQYQQAYQLLRQDNNKAQQAFENFLSHYPDDALALFHLARLQQGKAHSASV